VSWMATSLHPLIKKSQSRLSRHHDPAFMLLALSTQIFTLSVTFSAFDGHYSDRLTRRIIDTDLALAPPRPFA
jgi:hypothetical protein